VCCSGQECLGAPDRAVPVPGQLHVGVVVGQRAVVAEGGAAAVHRPHPAARALTITPPKSDFSTI